MANTPLTYNDIADVLRKTTLGYILQTNKKEEKMTFSSEDTLRRTAIKLGATHEE